MDAAHRRSRRVTALALAGACAAAGAACRAPEIGPRAPSAGARGPALSFVGAAVDGAGHVRVSFTLADGDAPVATAEAAAALVPTFTLAALTVHPVDGIAAWESLLPTGRQLAPALPPSGPGTPPGAVLADVRQPGSERDGALAGAGGSFTYVFSRALPAGLGGGETIRVGAWLAAAEGSASSTATWDFIPAGASPAPRETVRDEACRSCHAEVRAPHDPIVGVRICTTCHTWQAADPDTVDPAALDGASADASPNPLELGRLVHRIHRGRNLPTLHRSSSTDAAPPLDPPPAAAPPLPFFPGRNPAVQGRRYAVVGADGRTAVFGAIPKRAGDPLAIVAGEVFPRDLRDCAVCHEGAPQGGEALSAISRRTCGGCHPDVWFQDTAVAPITDEVHLAHTGGPQADDGRCRGCHVQATADEPKLWAPIAEIHVPPHRSPRFDRPVVEIVQVEDLRPGLAPTVRFKVYDRLGAPSPLGAYPAPAPEPGGSVLPRTMHYYAGGWFGITVAGPTEPAFGLDYLLSEREDLSALFALEPDADGVFTYAFAQTVPAGARGTWAVGIEARRAGAAPFYDAAAGEFRWPYTGEPLTEPPANPVVHVDTATGAFAAGAPGATTPRRKVVSQEKCERCHDPISVHGKTRMRVEYCVLCHSPERTDRPVRPGVAAAHAGVPVTGSVDLDATIDGIEERSIDLKVLIHRIHTGRAKGAATLEGIAPHVVYARYGYVFFLDGVSFPGDLADCTACHEGKSYLVESVPAGAPPTVANETATILHAAGADAHRAAAPGVRGCEVIPPVQAACLGCHASSATKEHVVRNTAAGVEACAQCHVRGPQSVEVAHGLAPPGAGSVGATWSAIAEGILAPRCASASCHGGVPPAYAPNLDAATGRAALVGVPSEQAPSMRLVEPYAPEASYLLLKIRGDGASAGGIGTPMPIQDVPLTPAEIAAIEAWIANGAPE